MFKTIVSILGVLLAAGAWAQGVHYEGDSIRLHLSDDGKGSIAGEITHNGATYPLTAAGKLDGRLSGSFVANQTSFEFVAASTADGLTFETGGKTYHLKRAAAPAVIPSEITFKRVEIKDAQMNNRVSHTMYIPEGWHFEGRTEWSQGTIIYPQQIIEARSPEGYSVRFMPALHLGYSEMDPDYVMQLKQSGLWDPRINQERSGIKPPEDIGEFLVAYIARNSKAVSDVRLVEQKRDRDAEAAFQKQPLQIAGDRVEFHVVTVEYQRDDAKIREEINLMYSRSEPMRTPAGTMWPYSITTTGIVSGPAGSFAQARPLLYAIARSLTVRPEWHYASQQALSQILAERHQANMEGIRRWGEAIRKAGEENSKLSDARFDQWKKDQKTDDEKQRDRVRHIYDIYTQTAADGSKIGVPLGHDHIYKTNDGKFIASEHPLANNPNLTPVEMK